MSTLIWALLAWGLVTILALGFLWALMTTAARFDEDVLRERGGPPRR